MSSGIAERVSVEVHRPRTALRAALAADVRKGLLETPKQLPPKWFYDERGSALFDEIVTLPEYYLPRRETEILAAHAADVAALVPAETLVELGSGSSQKTRLLLDALAAEGSLRRFVPFDVSEAPLALAAAALAADYPELEVRALVGDFEYDLDAIPADRPRLVAFLGSTIGNLYPAQRARFLAELATLLDSGEALLLGIDLVKDRARLEAAYDDPRRVTAAFNLNVLEVVNRELGGDFDPGSFRHVARWNPRDEWMEMSLRSRVAQRVRVAALGLDVAFAAGEELRTEISAKFRRSGVVRDLEAAGFEAVRWWTDSAGDFAVCLALVR